MFSHAWRQHHGNGKNLLEMWYPRGREKEGARLPGPGDLPLAPAASWTLLLALPLFLQGGGLPGVRLQGACAGRLSPGQENAGCLKQRGPRLSTWPPSTLLRLLNFSA